LQHRQLTPRFVRNLDVAAAEHPRAQAHLSSASGLVLAQGRLYTVADDEHHLGAFDPTRDEPVQLVRLLPGDLPPDKRERKKRKPDTEALTALPGARLLALGSGSKPNRRRGFLLAMNGSGPAREIDLSALYLPLAEHFADLNIEGAFVQDDHFHLLQRGNKGDARNARITFPLADVEAWLAGAAAAPTATAIHALELGSVDGVPLGCTDGAALPGGGFMFSAVAENTDDSYADGACGASAIGWTDPQGRIAGLAMLAGAPKVEGIALDGRGGLWMVTDADDPLQPSQLLALDALPWA
jgi:hypothetical protein